MCGGTYLDPVLIVVVVFVFIDGYGIVIKNNECNEIQMKRNLIKVSQALYVGIGIFQQRNSNFNSFTMTNGYAL